MENENIIYLVFMNHNINKMALDFTFETKVEEKLDDSELTQFLLRLSDKMGVKIELVDSKYIRNKIFRFKLSYLESWISLHDFGEFLVLIQEVWNEEMI